MIHTIKNEADPLDLLASQAAKEQSLAGADGNPLDADAAPVEMTNSKCLLMAFEVMRETLCSFAKVASPKQTMTNEIMEPVADAVGAVLDKYGISLSGVAGDFMTELKAAIVTVPVLLSIRAELQSEIHAKKEKTTQAVAESVE